MQNVHDFVSLRTLIGFQDQRVADGSKLHLQNQGLQSGNLVSTVQLGCHSTGNVTSLWERYATAMRINLNLMSQTGLNRISVQSILNGDVHWNSVFVRNLNKSLEVVENNMACCLTVALHMDVVFQPNT